MAVASYAQSGFAPLYERALRIQEEVLAAAQETRAVEAAWRRRQEQAHCRRVSGSPSRREPQPRSSRAAAAASTAAPRQPLRRPAEAWADATSATRNPRRSSSPSGIPGSQVVVSRLAVVDSIHTMLEQATDGSRAPGAQLGSSLQLLEVAVRRAHGCPEYMSLAEDVAGASAGGEYASSPHRSNPNDASLRELRVVAELRRATRRLETLRARAAERRAALATARSSSPRRRSNRAASAERRRASASRPMVHDLKQTSRGLTYRPQSPGKRPKANPSHHDSKDVSECIACGFQKRSPRLGFTAWPARHGRRTGAKALQLTTSVRFSAALHLGFSFDFCRCYVAFHRFSVTFIAQLWLNLAADTGPDPVSTHAPPPRQLDFQ